MSVNEKKNSQKAQRTQKGNKNKAKEPNYYYLDESVKQHEFSDFVRFSSFPHGMILYFGRFQPDEGKFAIFKSILLPFDVAESMSTIIARHIEKLQEEGILAKPETNEANE